MNVPANEKWQMTLSSHTTPSLQAKTTNPRDVTTMSFNNTRREQLCLATMSKSLSIPSL